MASVETAVLNRLGQHGVCTGVALRREARAGQSAIYRAFRALGDRVVRIGRGRGTRYGLRREIPRVGYSWPLIQIDTEGTPHVLGRFHALARDQYWFDSPLGAHARLSSGLPFILRDLVPQGFVGKSVPTRHADLGFPPHLRDWNSDQMISFLCQRGVDCMGNLMLGEASLQRFVEQPDPAILEASRREHEYPRLANEALAGTPQGSLAGGAHPKFTTIVRQGNSVRPVLVKFSPLESGAVAQRWSDLLVCEHVATRVLNRAGLTNSTTELHVSGGRTFIESPRFDRTGTRGRIAVISLAALSAAFPWSAATWPSAVYALSRLGVVSARDAETVRRLWTFGRLIANTDMHFGNLSFHLDLTGPMPLAPIYDMLPMLYAPVAGEVVMTREFEVPPPTNESLDIWESMVALAEDYWHEVADHPQLSAGFAAIANANATKVARARRLATRVR